MSSFIQKNNNILDGANGVLYNPNVVWHGMTSAVVGLLVQ